MSNGPHKYGTGLKYGNTGHFYGEAAEIFTEESTPPQPTYTAETASTPTYTSESASTPTYTSE